MEIESGGILAIIYDRGDVHVASGTRKQLNQLDISPIRVEEPIA